MSQVSSRVGCETQQSDLLALRWDVDGWDLYLSSQEIEGLRIICLSSVSAVFSFIRRIQASSNNTTVC